MKITKLILHAEMKRTQDFQSAGSAATLEIEVTEKDDIDKIRQTQGEVLRNIVAIESKKTLKRVLK